MNTKSTIQKLTLSALGIAAFAGAGLALHPTAAHADSSGAGTGVLLSTDGGGTWQAGTYSKILTFTLSTTQPAPEGEPGFIADSFGFGVEREMKAAILEISGLKMEHDVVETGDGINIGVGELQECSISKSMDSASPKLAQFAINGN